jgi:hypothetical protein
VHNLHVPGINAFVLAGGAVVHNCYDELLYACMSRPYVNTEESRYLQENWREIQQARRKTVDPYATV